MGTIYVGTSGWAYATWKPDFYPAKLASAKFLEHYATRLNSVEVNYTFRGKLTDKMLGNWLGATPAGFRFTLKAPQLITHIKRLRDAGELMEGFAGSAKPFAKADKLGPILVQLPPNFKLDAPRLEEFLKELPAKTRFAIEFRHASWFVDEVYAFLRKKDVALCIAESEDLDTPDVSTASFSYLRLRKPDYSAEARKKIAQRVAKLGSHGDVFVYFKHEETPEGALYGEELLRANR